MSLSTYRFILYKAGDSAKEYVYRIHVALYFSLLFDCPIRPVLLFGGLASLTEKPFWLSFFFDTRGHQVINALCYLLPRHVHIYDDFFVNDMYRHRFRQLRFDLFTPMTYWPRLFRRVVHHAR